MDRKLFNFKNIAMVAVFSLIAFVGFNSFKTKEAKLLVPVSQWYSITPTSLSSPSSQSITGTISAPPVSDDESCAQIDNDGEFCAVLIRFEDGIAPPVSTGTVADLLDTYEDSSISTGVASGGYSRLPATK